MFIFLLIGIISLIHSWPLKSNLCYDKSMDGAFYLNYNEFNQDFSTWYIVNPNEFFLLKSDKWGKNKYSRGSLSYFVDFKRDFHFHLKAQSKFKYAWDPFYFPQCKKNYGIAIILGEHNWPDYKLKFEDDLLFKGLDKSVVIAFRRTKDQVAIYNCQTRKCNPDDPTKKEKFRFTLEELNLNFHIIYLASKQTLKIYKNDFSTESNLILEYNVDLSKGLNYGYGIIGLTGTDYKCGYYNYLGESYICLNGGEKITPKVTLNYDKEYIQPGQSISVPIYETITLEAEYKTDEEKKKMDPGSILLNSQGYYNCYPIYDIEKKYSFICSLPYYYGEYKITYVNSYDSFDFIVKVQSKEISKLVYYYGKEEDMGECSEFEDNTRILKYGTLKGSGKCGGDFDLSEFEGYGYLTFYARGFDKEDLVEIRDIENIREALELSSNSDIILERTNQKYLYKVGVRVQKKGTYSITSNYLDHPITFYVKNLVPSVEFSSCFIENLLNKAYESDKEISYICTFRDENSDEIDVKESKNEKNVQIISKVIRLNDGKELSLHTYECQSSTCTYVFKTDYNGKYKFITQFGINGENMKTVKSISQNCFFVSPQPTTLEGALFYTKDTNWVKINELENTIFEYHEEYENNDEILFFIDLIDIKDPDKNTYSKIEQGYINFDTSKIEGKIYEEHSKYSKDLSFFIKANENNEQYIIAKLDNLKTEMRRTSFNYTVSLKFERYANLTFKYLLKDIGDYKACRNDLNTNNCIIKNTNSKSIKAGISAEVAQLILRTECYHLYNYFLNDKNKIEFNEDGENCSKDNNTCNYQYYKSDIDGIYNLAFRADKVGNYKIIVKVDGDHLLEGEDYYNIKVESSDEAYYLEEIKYDKKKYIAGEDILFGFRIKDKYENYINYELSSDNFGLEYSLIINGEDTSSIQNIEFVKGEENIYYIKESYYISGNYSLILKTKYLSSSIEFKYYKTPGKATYSYSTLKIINSGKLNLGDKSSAEIYLYDIYGNYLNSDLEALERELQNVTVFALDDTGNKIIYHFKEKNIFISEPIQITGSFYASAIIYGDYIEKCHSCNFEVVYNGFDFSLSQVKMIGERILLMTQDSYYTLYDGLQRPAFEFDFMTNKGLPSEYVDQNKTEVNAFICYNESEKEKLETLWISPNKLLWTLPDNYQFEKGHTYFLDVINSDSPGRKFYLSFVDYGDDTSKSDDYVISKTLVSPNVLYLKVGVEDSFVVEFKGEDNLRYNKDLDLTKFEIISSLYANAKLGNKKGQFIIDVKSDSTCDYSQNCIISLKYDNKDIETKVSVIITSGVLDHFNIHESCFYDKSQGILKPSTAGMLTKLILIPYDKYNNIIKENFFDSKEYSEESFRYLFNVNHSSDNKTSLSTSTNPASHNIELNINTEKTGIISLSSIYLDKIYSMEIKPVSASKHSIGYLDENINKTAGNKIIFIIEPKDQNGNKLTDEKIIKDIINDYKIKVFDKEGKEISYNISSNYNEDKGIIEYIFENEKTGKKIIKAYYKDEEIIVGNNIINVINGEPNFNKTKLIYNDVEYSLENTLIISLNSLPLIDLQFYDIYDNLINNLNNLGEMKFELNIGETQLLKYYLFNSKIRLYINESLIENYFLIDKSENYKLKLKLKSEERFIDIKFVDESPKKDKDEPKSFILNTDNLLLKAGEEGLVSLTFYSSKGKPLGYFFDQLSEITVSCEDEKNIKTKVYNGKYYGTYNIIVYSERALVNQISCHVNAKDLNEKTFRVKVHPNNVKSCKLSENSLPLPKAKAGETYELKLECLDEFGNKAYFDNSEFEGWEVKHNDEIIEANLIENNDNSYTINVEPTFSGEYTIKSNYLENAIIFNTLPGEISGENSYIEIDRNAKAGDDIYIYIYVLDKFNNNVDLDGVDYEKLFNLYYRYQEDSKYNNYQKIDSVPEKYKDEGRTAIKYKQKVTKTGVNEFRGIYQKTSTVTKCSNCEIKVEPGEINLNNFNVYKFNSFSQTYTKLEKKNDILYNYEENLFIKIYPKDSFGNKVSIENLNLKVKIGDIELEKTKSTEEFLEFQENNKFKNLEDGQYKLVISDNVEEVIYEIIVSGKNGFIGGFDPSKTKVLVSSLDFTAGKYGYFNFELRNENNARYKGVFDKEVKIKTDVPNLEYTIYNSKSSTILVLVTSTKANVFPNKGANNIQVLIEDLEILELEIIINPGDLNKAEINSKYIKSEYTLSPITTDDELKFSLIGYDSFNNLVLINPNEAKLIVKFSYEYSYKSCYLDLSNGEQNYIYQLTKTGLYTIKSEKKNLFQNEYKVEVNGGKISFKNSYFILLESEIIAGNKATARVNLYDKFDNNLKFDEEKLKNFSGYLLSIDYEIINADLNNSYYLSYIAETTKSGEYTWNIKYNNRMIKNNKNYLSIKPASCQPNNTIIYSKDKNGNYIEFNGENNAFSSYNSPLSLHLIFKDKYSNTIKDNKGIEVNSAYLYGNNMENLYWTYKDGYLNLDLNDENKRVFEYLVTRFNEKAYSFDFIVNSDGLDEKFHIKVNHFGKKDDQEEYGNGDYILDKCNISTNVAKFRAGRTFSLLLYLRTEEGLLYNGEFNIKYINCNELTDLDRTFYCYATKNDTGIYNIIYYTTMPKTKEQNISNIITLFDSKNEKSIEFKVLLINPYGIPTKEKTEIIKGLQSKLEYPKESGLIEFILFDENNNKFDSEEIIENLVFKNHEEDISFSINYKRNEKGEGYFSGIVKPLYPPKDISIQLYFREEGIADLELFKEPQKSSFIFNIDYSKTLISSKNINKMNAGELLDLNIILYDEKMQCYVDDSFDPSLLYITVQGPLEITKDIISYQFERYEEDSATCKYIYKIKINDENKYYKTGTYSIVVYVGENKQIAGSYTQTVYSGEIDIEKFQVYYTDMEDKSYNDKKIPAGETIRYIVQAYDLYNNKIDHDPLVGFRVSVTSEDEIDKNNYTNYCYNGGSGALSCLFNSTKTATYQFKYYYIKNNEEINVKPNTNNGPLRIIYVPGYCSYENQQTTYPNDNSIEISSPYIYNIKCADKYSNNCTEGGAMFTSEISLYIEDSQSTVDIESKVIDNGDGTYEISFIPPLSGEYSIYTYLDGKKYHEKIINITGESACINYTCPNTGKCVDDLRLCIPEEHRCPLENDEHILKPFRCDKTSPCVKSMTECDPEGALRCSYMNASYPKDKTEALCSFYIPLDCKRKYPNYRILCKDGICRKSKSLQPNQRVCPIGKILCLDLTCADSINDCYNDWPECGNTEIRCPDQSCVDDQKNCPTTITCPNIDDVVCPDGTCVENEIYCSKLKNCPEETPYLCSDNSCATNPGSCPHSVTCGHGKSLCSDLICRESC